MPISLQITDYLNYSISDKHKSLFADKHRLMLVYGGAGSGKSHAVAEKILFRMINEPDSHKILIIRKVAKTLLNSVWDLMLAKINRWGLSSLALINKTNKVITIGGNSLLFYGLDDVEKLKSIEGITSIWVEEASELIQDDLDQLDLRLRGDTKYYKQIILTFNPISIDHWIKKQLVDKPDKKMSIHHSTYLDNKHIDDEYKAVFDRLKETNRAYYNVYALGHWGVYEGLVFEDIQTIDRVPVESWDFIGYGIDFGFNAPSAIVQCYIKGRMLIVDEVLYKSQLTNTDLIQAMKQCSPKLQRNGWADSAEPDRIIEIQRAGFRVLKANKTDRINRINFVKSFIIQVTARSTNLLKELSTYVWSKDRSGNQLDEPIKINDHAIDAMTYCVYSQHNPPAPPKRFSQRKLGF